LNFNIFHSGLTFGKANNCQFACYFINTSLFLLLNKMKTNVKFKEAFFVIVAIVCSQCKPPAEEPLPPPNIVWITSEDNSVHYMDLFFKNGVPTPNIEKLAESGLKFTHTFSNTPVCSAARSTLISGIYGPRFASHYHRTQKPIPLPQGLNMFPAYLREAGYYTTNNSKEDYNFIKPDNVWDESSKEAHWRNRQLGQPFFHVFNISTTHESRLHFSREDMQNPTNTDTSSVFVQPNHPQTPLFRYTNAYYRDRMQQMDEEAGAVIKELEADSLLENTFVFYFADHGGVLPGSKGYLYETGLHVPLVVHIPPKYRSWVNFEMGSEIKGFVSFIDFAPTVLNLAGVSIPQEYDGKPFLGKNITMEDLNKRDVTYGYADRFDEKYDMVRSVRQGKYKYIRSYQPYNMDGLMNNYRYRMLAYQEWQDMYKAGDLNEIQSQFFKDRPAELLFDVETDPFETTNLAKDPAYADVLATLHDTLHHWMVNLPDLSLYPEHYLITNAWENVRTFGQKNQQAIASYLSTADLILLDFEVAKPNIVTALNSEDPWQRYWGLVACSGFAKKAIGLLPKIESLAKGDQQLINRVRAAEYLGITGNGNPSTLMLDALYATKNGAEALLVLNSIVLMQDKYGYQFNIRKDKLQPEVQSHKEANRRLDYLIGK
jgi:arylsulfatase A-like enzyme